MTTLTGTIRSWIEDRGFFFIRPADGQHDIFGHIRNFVPKGALPSVGMTVSYSERISERTGKPEAFDVTEIDTPRSTAKPETLRKAGGNDPWWT